MFLRKNTDGSYIMLKKIGKRILVLIIISALIFGCFVVFYKVENYYSNLPHVVTQLNGITLGDKLSDTLFKNSGFVNSGKNTRSPDLINEDFYHNDETKTTIEVEKNTVNVVRYACSNSYAHTKVNGISCGDNGEEIKERFASDVRVQCLKDDYNKEASSYRVYDITKYGIRYLLKTNTVIGFVITTPERLFTYTGKNWIACN
jgi:hypothetical protein